MTGFARTVLVSLLAMGCDGTLAGGVDSILAVDSGEGPGDGASDTRAKDGSAKDLGLAATDAGSPADADRLADAGAKLDTSSLDTSGLDTAPPMDLGAPVDSGSPPATFYVNAATGDDGNDGKSPTSAWKSIAKVNAHKLKAGEIVELIGHFGDQVLMPIARGTAQAPIVFRGAPDLSGALPVAGGIRLTDAEHLRFLDLELVGKRAVVTVRVDDVATARVRQIRFERLEMHDSTRGVHVFTGDRSSDLTFVDCVIRNVDTDGINLNDYAGDRFSYIGGSITRTGQVAASFGQHGVYASGGHGHLFEGVHFEDNDGGAGISLRRGDVTVRGCRFEQSFVSYFNEDEGLPGAKGLAIRIYRNVFNNSGGGDSIYQGGNNDAGIDDPGNTFLIFNNTFVGGRAIAQGGSTSRVQYYDVYVRNNVFVDSKVGQHAPVAGHVHVWSNNVFWNTTGARGTGNLAGDPKLDAQLHVTNPALIDAGASSIGPGVTLVAGQGIDQFLGAAPDVGATEH